MSGSKDWGSYNPLLPPQPTLKLEPLYFLQCHSKNNSPQDLNTQLWACAFEPACEEGTSLVGRQGKGHRVQTKQAFWVGV